MTKQRDLTKGNIYINLLWVAIPTLLSSIVQMAYNLTDMFWVGQVHTMGLSETEAIAGVGTAGYYIWFGFGFILLVKVGTSVKISHAVGRKSQEEITDYGNNGFVLMLMFALAYMVIGYFGAKSYVGLYSYENINIINYSIEYMQIVSMFGISLFMVNLFNGVYDGLGLTIMTFIISGTGLILNMILDPFFILETVTIFGHSFDGMGMVVSGAAKATVISQAFVLLIYITIYMTKARPFDLNPFKHFNKKAFKEIFRIGFPIGLQSVLFTIIAVIVAIMLAEYGGAVMATQRLGSQIEALAWMVASGFQVALASFVGQNFAAGRIDRVKQVYVAAMKILIPYGIVVNIVLYIFARQLFAIFITEPETLEIGKTYLEILSISQLFMILELSTAGAFNGLGKTKIPSMVGIFGNLLRIPSAYLLSISLGFTGIWWAVTGTSVLKGTVLVILFVYYLRKICLVYNDKVELELENV